MGRFLEGFSGSRKRAHIPLASEIIQVAMIREMVIRKKTHRNALNKVHREKCLTI
jgi:hypothetical protein